MFLFAQFLGVVSLIITILSFFTKKRSVFITYNLVFNIVLGIQYIMLDSLSGGLLCIFAAFRYIVYIYKGKNKFFSSILIPIFFVITNSIIVIFTFKVWSDIFPAVSAISLCITPWFENVKVLKIGSLAVCPLWFVYDILVSAWAALVMEFVTFVVTLIIFIISLAKEKQNKVKNFNNENKNITTA